MNTTGLALRGGQWVNHGGIRRWVPTAPIVFRWDTDELRRAHAAYGKGERDQWAREGERLYKREAKRRQRAQQAGDRGRPPLPLTFPWTDDAIRRAHTAYRRGDPSDWAREGERLYKRAAKRRQREAA